MTMARKTRQTIKPSEYRDFIEQVEIVDLRLVSARIENTGFVECPPEAEIGIKIKARYENGEEEFTVFHRYNVRVKDAETQREAAKLSAEFAVTYSSKLMLTDEIFDIFKELNLPVNTWPYFREFVHNNFGRMNWPPLIAPTFKVGTKPPKHKKS